jgi:hypothetical protein
VQRYETLDCHSYRAFGINEKTLVKVSTVPEVVLQCSIKLREREIRHVTIGRQ